MAAGGNRPDDIAEGVWVHCCKLFDAPFDPSAWTANAIIEITARAILAERERCAKLAERDAALLNDTADRLNNPRSVDPGWQHTADLHAQGAIVADRIAAAIRGER